MFSKYMIIVKDTESPNPFVSVFEYDDAEAAFIAYEDYSLAHDVVMYRRFKHDYVSI